ncbi:MAG: gephyrin-like molybdotransferase Glp [Crocinitomicaceae bacterium]
MKTVEEALKIVEENTLSNNNVIEIAVKNSFRYVLAEDVQSPIDMPPFPQSAMDGYAVNYDDQNLPIQLVGEVAAGQAQHYNLLSNQAVRIFTGAEVPPSANMVIRQEDVKAKDHTLKVSTFPRIGANIRPQGEQIRKGAVALPHGHMLNEASIGFLASLGISSVGVYAMPKVAVISTGDELVSIGETLNAGQIYDSNSLMLNAALCAKGFEESTIVKVKDNYQETVNAVEDALLKYDVLLCSGGISVGDYDFIGKALAENKVVTKFYKVKQKPGKPLFFGKKENTYVFGLPGNPAACLTGFYIYALPLLNKLKGGSFSGLKLCKAKLKSDYTRKGDRAEFLKGEIVNNDAEILEGQSSAMLKSFSIANGLIYVPIEQTKIFAGDVISYYEL